MSEGIVTDKILEALGGEKFTGDQPPGNKWSPNNYKNIYITSKFVAVETHVDIAEDSKVKNLDFIPIAEGEGLEFSYEEFAEVLEVRKLGSLEGVYVSSELGGVSTAEGIATQFNIGKDRLHLVGESGSKPGESVGDKEIPGSEGWGSRTGLQPEHYPMDHEGGDLWYRLRETVDNEGSDYENEDESDEEDKGKNFDEVESYYSDSVKGTLNKIIREYEKIFASGYEVLTPAGILLKQEGKPYGVLGRLEGTSLVKDKIDRNIQFLYREIKNIIGFTEVPIRSNKDLADAVVSGKVKGESINGNRPYFPYKMMEYAYGCKNIGSSGGESLSTYQEHALSASWESYAKNEVFNSLKTGIIQSIYNELVNTGLDSEPESPEANDKARTIMEKFRKAFSTAILVSTYDKSGDDLVAMKVRVLDPYGELEGKGNVLKKVLLESHGDFEGDSHAMVYPPEHTGDYYEFKVELDSALANAEPLFAYKALESLQKKGEKIDYESIVLGKDANDKIIRNGRKITLSRKLSHAVVAGSRAGKGVWTFSILAGVCIAAKPIFYLDDKPDMSSLFKFLAPDGFVFNGGNVTYDPEKGTDYFGQFTDSDSWINPNNVPDYVARVTGGKGYRQLGDLIYVKALIFVMGILASRVSVASRIDELGGSDGIVVVVDELRQADTGFWGIMNQASKLLANTGYYLARKEADEEGNEKIKGDVRKPSPEGYWFLEFYKGLERSLSRLQSLSNAGLKNSEASISDIFILTQEPPDLITSAGQVTEMFKEPRKGTLGIPSIEDSRIIPSLALLGGTDVFAGYDKDYGAFLNQKNPNSKAHSHLNAVNRGFGYISSYSPDEKERFNTSSLAEQATYYKPMLLFADGKTDSYFVQNALKNASDAGIKDPNDIIKRNEDPNNPGQINPAVGFQGYLEMAGVSASQITENLSKSGRIAQNVTDALGYPGTFQELIFDMRPEWMFDIDDIIDAMRGTPLSEKIPAKFEDFIYVYRDLFDTVSVGEETDDYEGEGSGVNWPTEEEKNSQEFPDFSGPVPQDEEDFTGPVPQDDDDFNSDWVPKSPEGSNYDEPYQVYDGDLGAEAVGGSAQYGDTLDFDNNASPIDAYNSGRSSVIPDSEKDTVDLSNRGEDRETIKVDWSNPSSISAAIEYLRHRVAGGGIDTPAANNTYGKGFYTSPSGEADNFHTSGGSYSIPMQEEFKASNPRTLADLVTGITRGAVELVGGLQNLKSVRVIDGTMILNQIAYKPKFSDEYLTDVPYDISQHIKSGNIAKLFDWSAMNDPTNIRRIAIDDVDFASEYLSDAMGWRGRLSVPDFFIDFPRLKHLTLGRTEFTRDTYRSQVKSDKAFYDPPAALRFADSVDNGLSKGTSSTWKWAGQGLRRKDVNLAFRLTQATAGATGAAVVGTAAVTTKAAKGIGSRLSESFRSIRKALKESDNF